MRTNQEEKISSSRTLIDILVYLKNKTMEDTNVSSLAYVRRVIQKIDTNNSYGILEVSPFPLEENQEEYSIQSYYFNKGYNNLNEKDIVLIVFTDKNFINNLKITNGEARPTQDKLLHSTKYGIVIKLSGSSDSGYVTEEELDTAIDNVKTWVENKGYITSADIPNIRIGTTTYKFYIQVVNGKPQLVYEEVE